MKQENRIERFSTHWQENYTKEPYYSSRYSWDDYDPAYRYAYKSYEENPHTRFDDIEERLEAGWDIAKGKSKLAWWMPSRPFDRPGTASSARCPATRTATGVKEMGSWPPTSFERKGSAKWGQTPATLSIHPAKRA